MEWILRKSIVQGVLGTVGRERFSLLPTPLHRLESVSREFGREVFCKRDDMTGFAFGGNKTRKLDFLMAEAKARGCDSIIAIGAAQSNFCRMAAAAASASGMKAHLVLGGTEPAEATGNLLLDRLAGAEIHYVDSDDWDAWEGEAAVLEDSLRKKGAAVYRLPMGGSTAVGSLGYVDGFFEILDQATEKEIETGTIVCAASSGGTLAGLVAGKSLCGWPGEILGFSVSDTAEIVKERALVLAAATARLLEGRRPPDGNSLRVDSSFMGGFYGARVDSCEKAILRFIREEGIVLDRVYSGKAAAGLLDYLENGKFTRDGAIIFIHTGGAVELFE